MAAHVRVLRRSRLVIGLVLLLATVGTLNLVRVPAALAAGAFSLGVTQQPPTSAAVGSIVHSQVTIAVGSANLSLDSISAGPGTKGLDQVVFSVTSPLRFAAGTSTVLSVSARLVSAPGTTGNRLEVDMAGRTGAAQTETQTVTTHTINTTEAVTGALSATKTGGGPATTVSTTDRITYTLA
ncbi:MAG TPA: hypothetical protein VGJ28_05455 [Micromonosporaceae bacterium]